MTSAEKDVDLADEMMYIHGTNVVFLGLAALLLFGALAGLAMSRTRSFVTYLELPFMRLLIGGDAGNGKEQSGERGTER